MLWHGKIECRGAHIECRKRGSDMIAGQQESTSLLLWTDLCVLWGQAATALPAATPAGRGMTALSKEDLGSYGVLPVLCGAPSMLLASRLL